MSKIYRVGFDGQDHLIVYAFPGSGKTTFMKKAKEQGLLVVDTDQFRVEDKQGETSQTSHVLRYLATFQRLCDVETEGIMLTNLYYEMPFKPDIVVMKSLPFDEAPLSQDWKNRLDYAPRDWWTNAFAKAREYFEKKGFHIYDNYVSNIIAGLDRDDWDVSPRAATTISVEEVL